MSDDNTDKTEEPTDHKLKKAKEEGNVPKSEDLTGFMGILAILIICIIFYVLYPEEIKSSTGKCLVSIWSVGQGYTITPECLGMINVFLGMMSFAFGLMIFFAFVGYFIMNKGFVIPKEPLKFNIDALNIGTNFKNLFNAQNVVGLAISVLKEILFYLVMYICIVYFMPAMVYEMFCFENCSGISSLYYILALIVIYSFLALIFAAIDYPLKIHFWKDKLKMSHKDLKDEHKEMEGSPEIKHAQQEFRWEMMNSGPSGPKNATFFVKSGTSIWGIRYNREESPAPIIVAMGKNPDQIARVTQVANLTRRLVIQDDEFAKLLLGKAVMGRPIPLEYVAQVRRCIMQLRQWEGQHGPVHPPKK